MGSALLWFLMFLIAGVFSGDAPGSCTFENGMCAWKLSNTRDFDWRIGKKSTPDRTSGPSGDHTLKGGKGYYIFIQGKDAWNKSMSAIIETKMSVTHDFQMSFWYFMNGIGIGSLSVKSTFINGTTSLLWKREGRQGKKWRNAVVSLPMGNFTITFEATSRRHFGGDLALDDITVEPSIAPTTTTIATTTQAPPRSLPFTCHFDYDVCGMQLLPSVSHSVGWNLTKNLKPLITRDNTTGAGKFLLLSNWRGGENGDAARVISPNIATSGPSCLTLALMLPNERSGTLSVYQENVKYGTLHLIHEASYRGYGWRLIYLTLFDHSEYRVIIEGSYTGVKKSVIGLDDISIQQGKCPDYTTTPPPPTTPTTPTMPVVTVVNSNSMCQGHRTGTVPQLTCDFQRDYCTFNRTETFSWKRYISKSSKYSSSNAINSSHSGDKEYYLATNVDNFFFSRGSLAYLQSEPIHGNGSRICLHFWYILTSDKSNIQVAVESEWGNIQIIWKSGYNSTHNVWLEHSLDISYPGIFKVMFRSTKKSSMAFTGLDDISAFKMEKELPTTLVPTDLPSRETSVLYTNSISTSKAVHTNDVSSAIPHSTANPHSTVKPHSTETLQSTATPHSTVKPHSATTTVTTVSTSQKQSTTHDFVSSTTTKGTSIKSTSATVSAQTSKGKSPLTTEKEYFSHPFSSSAKRTSEITSSNTRNKITEILSTTKVSPTTSVKKTAPHSTSAVSPTKEERTTTTKKHLSEGPSSEITRSHSRSTEKVSSTTLIHNTYNTMHTTTFYRTTTENTDATTLHVKATAESTNNSSSQADSSTTGIVLGVCIPLIAIVILSVGLLLYKKDQNYLALVKKKVAPGQVKDKYNTTENVELECTAIRKIET